MRASDADRDRTAAALREHMAAGRLTLDELEERLEQTYRARTMGELQLVTEDLPEQDLHELPIPAGQRSHAVPFGSPPPARRGLYSQGLMAAWAAWASVNLVCFTVWLISVVVSASWIYPWWAWVAGPWGAVLLAGTIFGPRRR